MANLRNIVSAKIYGETYSATWTVHRGIVTVYRANTPPVSTQLGDQPPETVARSLLRTLILGRTTRHRREPNR